MSEFEPEAQVVVPAETASDASQEVAAAATADQADEAVSAPPSVPESRSPVAAALAELDTLSDRDLAEHPDVYQRIHGELQRALSAIDDA